MEKVIKNEFGLSNKTKIGLTLSVLAFFGLSVFIYAKLYTDIKTIVSRQAVNSIKNISELNVDAVSRSLENRQILLETLSQRVEEKDIRDVRKILEEIGGFASAYQFQNMGILDRNLRLHMMNGNVVDVSEREQFQDAWDEDFHLSESYMPADGGEYAANLFSYPIYFDGEMTYVIMASYQSVKLTERMNTSSIGEDAYNYLLNDEGHVVIYPRHYEDEEYNGLMKYINETPEIIPDESGDSYFQYQGERYYSHFERMGINNWFLMTCSREDDVFADANVITSGVFMGMGILWTMIILAIFATIYSMYRSKKELRQAVFYDPLLGIENGNFLPVFFEKLPLKEAKEMFLTIFDIDKFKEFNYIYGEECGDELLKYIVRVFQEEMPQDYLFRYLADHFVALIHSDDRKAFAEKFDRVLDRFTRDIDENVIHPFDISAGIRKMYGGETFRRVISDALIAKGTVKGIQVQQYAFFDEDTLHRRMDYMSMESDFARALRDREFHVYYQPKYDMTTGKIIGAEALVRWVKEDGTVIPPSTFVPCYETSRQIILLDEAMLEEVCRQMKEMEAEGLPVKKVSVNLSRVHLRHHGILPKIEKIIRESGVSPSMLSFEITESALYEDSIPLKNIVDFLHKLGCRVDMDDYGIGVSGPNALAANTFDTVKLDKSFIDGIGNERMEAVIKSTICLSRTLGMEIVAEGVEEKCQAERLVEWGCTNAQGFYYSRPVPEETYRRMLQEDGQL